MCMFTIIGTDSNEDLGIYNTDLMVFKKVEEEVKEVKWLTHKNVWFLTDKHESCSCGFRNVEAPNIEILGFGKPEEWSPEDENDIEATHQAYSVIKHLVESGYSVESVSAWADSNPEIKELSVNLKEIDIEKFRFFDGYLFKYDIKS